MEGKDIAIIVLSIVCFVELLLLVFLFPIKTIEEIEESKLEDDYDRADSLEYCLSKLQELKGVDKE